MKKIYTVGFLLSVGAMFSSFNGITSEINTNVNPQNAIYQSPLQEDNPYPIITNVHSKIVNGEEITLVDANGISAFIAGKNQNLLLIATSLNVDVKKIYKYNDMDAYDDLMEGHVYYLKSKKGKATTATHTTIDEKNLWEVSQKYGIKLKSLAKKNRMKPDEPLARGRVLFLQKTRPKSVPPKVIDIPEEVKEEVTADSSLVETIADPATVISIVANDSVPALNPNSKTHTVQDGESVFTISRMYNVTMLDLKNWNNIGDDLSLEEGQVLIVGKEEEKVIKEEVVATPVETNVATEQPAIEESSFEIIPPADNTAVTVTPAAAGNQAITVGEAITVGAVTVGAEQPAVEQPAVEQPAFQEPAASEQPTAPETYVVQQGEFYYGIARKFGVTPQNLQAWNNNKALKPGDEIYVSNPSAAGPAASSGVYAVRGNTNIDAEGPYTGQIIAHPTQRGETVKSIAATYGLTENDIYTQNRGRLNPGDQPKNGMMLQIPIDKANGAQSNYNQVAAASTQPAAENYNVAAAEKPLEAANETVINTTVIAAQPTTTAATTPAVTETVDTNATMHTVQKGETLFAISRKYSVYHKDLIKWNNLPTSGAINEGQTLRLTAPEESFAEESFTETASSPGIAEYHVVEKGDTLFSVSRKYGVTVGSIKDLNGMTTNEIKIGQRLQVK
ncbi:LysM peptidoglycan-binding domain-containing protein [Flammeovirga sp. EKP202]|uniref:LysM peptidoglycan-binding domain-containing protein n=1 Tax=Flammeovirga sp. EKP202 TaxID=2770592 RepID=UPI00165F4A71|nr:LysM peptidoglycan-binding domain-containing protein [Flammeovirga sp. EKP202]MBD0404614.1 LysM peptidoglycan-binding domain-containing protein [Flammeovirga sp. EKP202]